MAVLRTLLALMLMLGAGAADLASGAVIQPFAGEEEAGFPMVQADDFSVMTYNIHGMPWPIADDRSADLIAIGARMRQLHWLGKAPRVALIQEAFTAKAKAIAHASGYRYAAFGPGDDGSVAVALPPGVSDATLRSDASWAKGEGVGKWEDGGLMILSDYPIVRVRRMAYSADACAGYDCLAAKGAILAELALPDGRRVEIVNTHLNSRHASGVSTDRANRAWLVQVGELREFIGKHRNRALPLIVGGDLNVGHDLVRQLGLADMTAGLDRNGIDALHTLHDHGVAMGTDANGTLAHGKDWELVLGGTGSSLKPRAAWVPFGSRHGAPLSDHLGYAVSYTAG